MAGKRKGAAPLSGRQADCCAPTSGTRQNFAGARSPPLGKLQTTCFIQSEASETFKQLVSSTPRPRKPSNNLFHPIRDLGNLQTTCFIQPEASETFKQPVWTFPRPRAARLPPTCTKPNFAGLARPVAVCEMSVQHLHSPFTVCGGTMQHLHSPFTVCGETMQHLHSLFTVCETIMQPLHSLVAVCETAMQHLHSLAAVCAPVRRLIIHPCGMSGGRIQYAPTRVPGKLRCPRRGRMQFAPTPGTRQNFAAPAGAVPDAS